MSVRIAVAVCIGAAVIVSYGQPAAAQADAHARAIARASCQSSKHSDTVADARAAVAHQPDDLGPQMRLADALVDQGCYQEAVTILEAAQQAFPRNTELTGKLRDVRSLVTEQTYIEGLTQAAEGAKFSRNQLRCTRLADLTACEDALRSKPDDPQLLQARAALLQAKAQAAPVAAQPLAAAAASPPALVASNTAPHAAAPARPPKKVVAAGASVAAAARQKGSAAGPATAPQSNGGQHLTTTPATSVAALAPSENKTYSNDAPPGQTN